MSDMNIPGVTGTYDKYVEALMKVERIPRDNAQKDLDTQKSKRAAWQTANRLASDLRKSANTLYSFNNPFAEKVVGSSEEKAITATASRSAENASFKVKVDKIASSDSFLSNPIDKKMEVAPGTYTFVVGDKTISFNWKGGNYRSFVEAINKRGKGILSVSEIKTTANSSGLLFKSEVLGEANRLKFEDDASTFALENGILKKNDTSAVGFDRQSVVVQPLSSDKIAFSKTVRGSDGNILEITVSRSAGGASGQAAQTIAPAADENASNKTFEQLGSLSYQGITITNEASSAGNLPVTEPLQNSAPSPAN